MWWIVADDLYETNVPVTHGNITRHFLYCAGRGIIPQRWKPERRMCISSRSGSMIIPTGICDLGSDGWSDRYKQARKRVARQRVSRCSPPQWSLEGLSLPPALSPWLAHVSSRTQRPPTAITFSAELRFRSLSVATTVANAEASFVVLALPAPPLSSIPPASTFSFHPKMSPRTSSRQSHVC